MTFDQLTDSYDQLVDEADDGMRSEEIFETYCVPVATIRALIDYAAKHRAGEPQSSNQ